MSIKRNCSEAGLCQEDWFRLIVHGCIWAYKVSYWLTRWTPGIRWQYVLACPGRRRHTLFTLKADTGRTLHKNDMLGSSNHKEMDLLHGVAGKKDVNIRQVLIWQSRKLLQGSINDSATFLFFYYFSAAFAKLNHFVILLLCRTDCSFKQRPINCRFKETWNWISIKAGILIYRNSKAATLQAVLWFWFQMETKIKK